jgi:hypothetical protein
MLRVLVVSMVVVLACGQPFWTPPPAVQPPPAEQPLPALRPLPTGDWRRAFLGTWRVLFTFDSGRHPVRAKPRWQFVTTPMSDTLHALFHLRDTLADADGSHVASSLEFDSLEVPLMPWPSHDGHRDTLIRWFPRPHDLQTTILERGGGLVTFQLVEGCRECRPPYNEGCFADCAFPHAEGAYWGDSIVGTWRDVTLGLGVFGRLRMVRIVPGTDSE